MGSCFMSTIHAMPWLFVMWPFTTVFHFFNDLTVCRKLITVNGYFIHKIFYPNSMELKVAKNI